MEKSNKNKSNEANNIIGKIFFNKYHCIEKVGEGSFGFIYKAEYNGNYYALKFEKIHNDQQFLENEAAIMDYLKGPNIPYIYYYSSDFNYNIMVMQLLGKNLENIFEEKGKFSLKTVCMIGYQFVSILEYIHNRHIIHRDIKPDNFVLGLNELSQYIYIIDFGLAKKYRSSKTLEQLPFTNRGKIIGTARYASINALKGYELSRRDDLESAGYVLLYFIKGKLPWQGIITKTKDEKYKKILEKKEQISSKKLCEGLPQEFNNFIDYVRNLDYLEQPDYEMLRGLFNTMLRKDHNKFDYIYDWTTYEERLKRRVITPRSEIDSFQNKKSTLASYKNFGDSKEESSEPLRHLSIKKNNSNDLSKKDENVKNYNIYIVNTYKKNGEIKEESEEENIIISNKRGQLNSINKKEDEICCNFECNIF